MDMGLWRDISLIFLIPQAMLLSLVPLALLGAMVYGMRMVPAALRRFFVQVRAFMAMIHIRVEQFSAAVTAPLISAHALAARLSAWKRYITRELRL
jgi:hypothetical protein